MRPTTTFCIYIKENSWLLISLKNSGFKVFDWHLVRYLIIMIDVYKITWYIGSRGEEYFFVSNPITRSSGGWERLTCRLLRHL